ncbi:MAG: hypothetical protein JWQ98_2220 [Chlorobi bacterium]|nr:hypothetical protein [Chlorobiota bacterium]
MHFRSTTTLKNVTLNSAVLVFNLLVGLALKNVLIPSSQGYVILDNQGHVVPSSQVYVDPKWWVVLSYCVLALWFVHKVTLLQGIENERFNKGMIPAPWRLTSLAAIAVVSGIAFVLMSRFITKPEDVLSYLVVQCVLAFVYTVGLAVGSNIRRPLKMWRRYRYLSTDYTARMAHTWLLLGILWLSTCLLELFASSGYDKSISLSCAVVVSASIALVDFIVNASGYLGGSLTAALSRLVFIRVPLTGPAQNGMDGFAPINGKWCDSIESALNLCDFVSHQRQGFSVTDGGYSKLIVPFSPLAFYSFLLDLNQGVQRRHALYCSAKFLDAFHSVHYYDKREDAEATMVFELARMRGLDIYIAEKKITEAAQGHVISGKPFLKVDRCDLYSDLVRYHNNEVSKKKWERASLKEPIKRVFVCSPLIGEAYDKDEKEMRRAATENTRRTLWYCYQLMISPDESVAPIAPHAFYPLFLDNLRPYGGDWQRLCVVVLRACDAIYIYTTDGLPSIRGISSGMRSVYEKAVRMGIEIQFRKAENPPGSDAEGGNWLPCMQSVKAKSCPEIDEAMLYP